MTTRLDQAVDRALADENRRHLAAYDRDQQLADELQARRVWAQLALDDGTDMRAGAAADRRLPLTVRTRWGYGFGEFTEGGTGRFLGHSWTVPGHAIGVPMDVALATDYFGKPLSRVRLVAVYFRRTDLVADLGEVPPEAFVGAWLPTSVLQYLDRNGRWRSLAAHPSCQRRRKAEPVVLRACPSCASGKVPDDRLVCTVCDPRP